LLRKIFGPKHEKGKGSWRQLHDEFHNVCPSQNTLRVIRSKMVRWNGHVWEIKLYSILVRKPERKRPFGRYESRWDDNIKTDNTIMV